jgi:phosphoglucomutase/phosphomannomutase
MDPLARAAAGIATLDADEALKRQALTYLGQWLTRPEFAAYRPQIEWLIDNGQWPGLLDRFCQILPFGTGGRRGAVGIGPNRMNLWTLGASVQGHCEYLKERFPGVDPLVVVLAYDVRQFEDQRRQYNPKLPNPVLHLSSRDIARHAACVYAANAVHAYILPAESTRYLSTPELSFTVRLLGARGGLNVSASHNPPDDNGGKFYDERGGQPVPPEDQIIADLVEQVSAVKVVPFADAVRTGRIHFLDEAPHAAYIDLCRRQSVAPAPSKGEDFKVVFSPMHGVGSQTAMEVLEKQGFRVFPVAEQMAPDGQFPNVTKTPNPEVPESMDRAAELGKRMGADLVLATDPDADRLGAMAPDRDGNWHVISGNEIAALLTHFKLSRLAAQGRMPPSPIVVRTDVTTGQVTRIARHFRAQVVDNLLVGFKYVADVLWHLERDGAYEDVRGTPEDFVIGVEESHGILVTPHIRDKDAGASALLLAELALEQKRHGRTVPEYLDRLGREFGYFRNAGVPVFMRGVQGRQQMVQMLDRLRVDPPREVGGLAVTNFEDLRDPGGRLGPHKGGTDAASRNVLVFRLGERARVTLRPSGTEPKAKIYLEACSAPCPSDAPAAVWNETRKEVENQLGRAAEDFVRQALARVGLDPAAAGAG